MSVRIITIKNKLIERIGLNKREREEGGIDPDAIEEAEKLVTKLKGECPAAIKGFLGELTEIWTQMRDLPDGEERFVLSQQVFTVAHEIKDLAALAGEGLVVHFSESLRDYIGQTNLTLEAQRVIVQAHVDALAVVVSEGLQDGDSAQAEELKSMVKIAIEKYQ